MKLYRNIALILLILMVSIILIFGAIYNYMIAPVSRKDNLKLIEIKQGSSAAQIGKILKDNNLIKNELVFKLYLRMNDINKLEAGRYNLNENMNLKTIVQVINKGEGGNPDTLNITFPEGKNIRQIAAIIEKNTNNTANNVLSLLKNEEYIDSLISKYWFLTDEIKNKAIYYSLEGYLFPNTYNLKNKDIKVEEIFEIMLKQTDKILTKYKEDIEKSDFTVHEFLTLASIVEGEGVKDDDRGKIAGVFYNRLEQKIPLESCVTNCYATKTENCIPENVNKNYISPYNTYLGSLVGELPVGPVSNPGEAAIIATINPIEHDFLFFCADIYRNTYFSKTNSQHEAKIKELKDKKIFP